MGLLGPALAVTRKYVQEFLNDPEIRELVTYKKWASQEFDDDQGHNVDVYSSTTSLRALRLKATESATMFDHLEVGEVIFMMASPDLPSNISSKDQIVDDNNVVFKVSEIQHVFGIVTAFRVEGNVK